MSKDPLCPGRGSSEDDRRRTGKRGEALALRALKKSGYKIVEQNYRSKLGEIDIIAKEAGVLAFVEVKARRTDQFGGPKQAITA
ncbi:MAG: YraN family protein, partial [Thermodesulfobacteriota bacterium]|nr:YraN family protein [Thermodesulfobacteriota bacterium]